MAAGDKYFNCSNNSISFYQSLKKMIIEDNNGNPSFYMNSTWNPLNLNPDLFFDFRNLEEFENNSFADTSTFQNISTVYNQVSVGNDGIANSNIPIIQRQSVFGYNSMNCRAGAFTVNNYSEIDYQYNEPFYIAFAFSVFDLDNRTFLNKRPSVSPFKGGYYVKLTNKILFGFSDSVNGDVLEVQMDTSVNDFLPHTLVIQNTNGTASGINFYLDGVLQPKTIITNLGGLNDIKGGSLKVGTAYASSHDAPPIYLSNLLIGSGTFNSFTQYQNFCTIQNRWEVLKYPTNPVISGTTQNATQAYPSGGMYWAATGKYYRYVGSTPLKIVCFSSLDGLTWVEEGVVVTAQAGTWNETYVTSTFVRVVGTTIYLFMMGNSGTSPDFNYATGYYTSTSPTSGFVQNTTPIMTSTIYNSAFNRNMTGAFLYDVVKVGSVYYWFGAAQDVCRSEIFIATSNSLTGPLTPLERVFTYTEADYKRSIVQGPMVFKTSWGWIMTYTLGFQAIANNERNIRSAYTTNSTPTGWTLLNEDYLNPTYQKWDTVRVYVNSFFKKIDDDSFINLEQISSKYSDYYSGHDLGANAGQTGLAQFSSIPDLRNGRTYSQPTFNSTVLDPLPNCLTRIFSDEHVYFNTDGKVFQVLSSVNYKEATPIGADGERPTRVVNELNGLPIIRFNQTRLRYGKALGNPSSWTATFVVKTTSLASVNNLFGALNSSGGQTQDLIQIMTTGAIRVLIGNDAATAFSITLSSAGDILVNNWYVITVSYTNGDNFMRIYKNGIELSTTKPATTLTSVGTVVRSFGLGAASFNGTNTFVGDLAYFAMYNSALSNSNIQLESNYLKTKYNL